MARHRFRIFHRHHAAQNPKAVPSHRAPHAKGATPHSKANLPPCQSGAYKLYEKLGAANRAQALMTALRVGLLEAPDAPKF